MDFRQILHVLAVAEEGNITKAAAKLHIAQPSLSQSIQKVEKQLGVLLFDRSQTPIALTPEGQRYVEISRMILNLREQLRQDYEDSGKLKKGRIIIGTSSFRGCNVLPGAMVRFHELYPDIEVILQEGDVEELEELTLQGKTDITLRNIAPDLFPELKPIRDEPVINEEILLALPHKHPLARAAERSSGHKWALPIDLAELKDTPFIIHKAGENIRKITDRLFEEVGFFPKVILETASTATALCMVEAGLGAAFLTETAVNMCTTVPPPVFCSVKTPPLFWTFAAAYREGKYLTRASREFISVMREVMQAKLE